MERDRIKKRKSQRRKRLILRGLIALGILSTAFGIFIITKPSKAIELKKAEASSIAVTPIKPQSSALAGLSLKISKQGMTISGPDIKPKHKTKVKSKPKLKSLGEFILTAYCPCVKCCGIWSSEHPSRAGTDYIQKTASGTVPEEGRTIGVDPDVIPYGTVVVINGHEYIAEDKGGAIKRNRIDVYFDSHDDALKFGKQKAEAFIKQDKEN